MNRTILIVICDFLLVSLLAFSSVDIDKVAQSGAERKPRPEIATSPLNGQNDLAAVMRMALDDERRNRELLLQELSQTREAAERAQAQLNEREKQVREFMQALDSRQREASDLQKQQASLEQQFALAQASIRALTQELELQRTEANLSKEKVAEMENELRKRTEESAALQVQLARLAESNQVVSAEKQRLATELRVAEVERLRATEQVAAIQEQVKIERQEKAKLVEGVQALASQSEQLAQEIREQRILAANAIFSDFATNRVQAKFSAYRPVLFGITKETTAQTILVTDGTNIFAICHVTDTPLTLANPGTDWERLSGSLVRGTNTVPLQSISFHSYDPRVVLIPVSEAEARQLGGKLYPISTDPFKFQDAVLVGTRDGYYGECKFEIDLSTPNYVKLERSFLRGLAGKFNPSKGDLVFSKSGELLGVMANSTYCLRVTGFRARTSLQFGSDLLTQRTGRTLSSLYMTVLNMPLKLQ
jgi:hypothetical protein